MITKDFFFYKNYTIRKIHSQKNTSHQVFCITGRYNYLERKRYGQKEIESYA